jgi:hypothetical protein
MSLGSRVQGLGFGVYTLELELKGLNLWFRSLG